MGWLQEFRKFAMRGNVVDMAVGIVIGAAFGRIVSSFVDDLLMPPLGLLLGNMDLSAQALILREGTEALQPVLWKYGAFVTAVVDFLIVAFAIFLLVKAMNRARRKEEAAPEAPPADVALLTEIRDELRRRPA